MQLVRLAILGLLLAPSVSGVYAQEATPPSGAQPAQEPQNLPPSPQAIPQRIRVGANVAAASLVHQVPPVYPPLAKTAHIEGTVVLHATIGRDGTVANLEYVSGPPLLMRAAIDAVKQWRYKPTLLNSQPVEVDTTISVTFALNGNKPASTTGDVPALPPGTTLTEISTTGPPYPDTIEGMKSQMGVAFQAWRVGDKQKFAAQLDSFAFSDPKAWLMHTFGDVEGAALVPDYETSLEKFRSHISWVSGNWAESRTATLLVESTQLPTSSAQVPEEHKSPKPVAPLKIENFRFTVANDEEPSTDWVFSFAHVDGAFRIVGGTYPFWDKDWQLQHSRTGAVQLAKLVHSVTPEYPQEAKKMHIEGTVHLHAVIGKDGRVNELSVIDGDPDLARAAMKAVHQWRYEPTLLDGKPVEVNTTISVVFSLNH